MSISRPTSHQNVPFYILSQRKKNKLTALTEVEFDEQMVW